MKIQIGPYLFEDESAKIPDTVVLVGRYQPFTIGHEALYKDAKKVFKNVIIGPTKTNRSKIDERNPFTTEEKVKLIKKAVPGAKVIPITNLYYEKVFEDIGKPVVIGVGKDREDALKKMGGREIGSKATDAKFWYWVFKSRPVSATQVRNAILKDDVDFFRKMTPKGIHSEYDWMRERILEVNGER